MTLNRPAALTIAGLGLLLAIAAPLLPGGPRLTRESPPDLGHVTALARGADRALLVGTQDGVLWRRSAGHWARLPIDLHRQPVTALLADSDPAQAPIGTGGGLVNGPPGLPVVSARILDLAQGHGRLVLATGNGLLVQGDGAWRTQLTGSSLYRLHAPGGDWWHVGSIGAGVFSARAADLADWRPNGEGLPAQAKVFAFATTAAGRLIAGSDQGLHWQGQPFKPWQPLRTGLDNSRILALQLAPPASDGTQRLMLGTDAGLYQVDLGETGERVVAAAYAAPVDADTGEALPGIGFILPDGDGVLFSAGAVFRYGPSGLVGWYWVSLAGLALVLLGGLLLPPRREP